ncbi:MAG: SRPBCC family protein [Myxococcaceae bacterium]
MLRKILIGVVAVVLVLVIIIATRPATYRVERSTRIAAPPDMVFGLVNDFHAWDGWSPWAKLDPSMKTTYGGPASGVGATYAWVGDSKVGEGKMTITESRPSKVGIRLEFIKPMAGTSQTDFGFQSEGGGTQVNWVMTGTNDFLGKAFSLVADMDAMIGKDFDKGLAAMRTEAEAEAKRRSAAASAVAPATATIPPAPAAPPAQAR